METILLFIASLEYSRKSIVYSFVLFLITFGPAYFAAFDGQMMDRTVIWHSEGNS